MARFPVLVLLLACALFAGVFGLANPNECDTADLAACNTNGKCLATSTSGFCTCYSGYSGEQCSTTPPGGYVSSLVSNQHSVFAPYVDFSLGGQVTFVTLIPSEVNPKDVTANSSYSTDSSIFFSNSTETSCDYPAASQWTTGTVRLNLTGTPQWYDKYVGSFDYSQLVECGLKKLVVSTRVGYAEFSAQLFVKRNYILSSSNGKLSLPRSESLSKGINIFFPTVVQAQSNVDVIDNSAATFTGVTKTAYEVSSDSWTFSLSVAVTANYQVQPTGTPITSQSSRNITFGTITTCSGPNNETCVQDYTIKADGCDPLDFSFVLNLEFVCRANNPQCVAPAVATVNPSIRIKTGSACPISESVAFNGAFMEPYSDSALTLYSKLFGTSQTLYFAVGFNSVLNVTGVSIGAVCARSYTTNPSTACGTNSGDHSLSSATSSPFSNSTLKFAFAVRGSDFNQFAITPDQPQRFVVQADLVVDTVVGNKKSVSYQTSRTSTDVSITSVKPLVEVQRSSAGSVVVGVAAMLIAVATLL